MTIAILRIASILAPRDQRAEWMEWWRSELWYVPQNRATRFCLGTFRDAFWLRRNNLIPAKRGRGYLASPVTCLTILAILAAASISIEPRLETMLPFFPQAHGASALGGIAELAFFYLFMTAVALLAAPGARGCISRPNIVRSWIFLALKIILVLPVLHCALVAVIVISLPFLTLGFFAAYMLLFRWVFADQRRRCPVCLRLLTKPVRIGTPSETFLRWYGAESICARGHGLLHASGVSASYSAARQWLSLDDSYKGLLSQSAGARQ